jgi:hypothetical protein
MVLLLGYANRGEKWHQRVAIPKQSETPGGFALFRFVSLAFLHHKSGKTHAR